jgi:hypothetical protein
MASLFDTLQANAFRAGVTARTKESQKWFQDKIKDLPNPSRKKLLTDPALDPTTKTMVGSMYMYMYDPKTKKDLPYYDRFPLTILMSGSKKGFSGLNLHYLPYNTRALFLDELMSLAPNKLGDTTRIRTLRYELIAGAQKYKEFKPCFKQYLNSHVKSRFVRVPMTDWEIAIFLPVEQFVKKNKTSVWTESLKIAKG